MYNLQEIMKKNRNKYVKDANLFLLQNRNNNINNTKKWIKNTTLISRPISQK